MPRSRSGKCIHCLRWHEKLTWDHVIPRSFLPDTIPPNILRPKVPACRECNEANGKAEENLIMALGMCLNPENLHARAVCERVIRSMDPGAASTLEESKRRLARRRSFARVVRPLKAPPTEGVMPGFGIQPEHDPNDMLGIDFPVALFAAFVRKVARGATWIQDKVLIGPEYEFRWTPYEGDGWPLVNEAIDTFGEKPLDCGPGVVLRRAATAEDRAIVLIRLELWEQLKIVITTRHKDRDLIGAIAEWNVA